MRPYERTVVKPKRAELKIYDNSIPFSKWFIRNTSWRQLMKREWLTFLVVVRKLEKKNFLREPGEYTIRFKSTKNFSLSQKK